MTYFLINYDPGLDRKASPGSKMPFEFQGIFTIAYPKTQVTKRKGAVANPIDPIDMGYLVLKKGINQVIADEWTLALSQLAESHSATSSEIVRQIRQGVIKVYKPDENKQGRNSSEFSDYNDLVDIISNQGDRNWLNFSLQVERRTSEHDGGDVQTLLRARLQELDDNAAMILSNGVLSY
jgi:hypothetical protein